MAASLIIQPPPVAYTNSPIYIKIGTNQVPNIKTAAKIKFTSIPSAGETITLTFDGIDYIFECKPNPTTSEPYALDTNVASVLEFCESAHLRQDRNATINDLFDITHGTDYIQFAWKNVSPISLNATTTTSATITTTISPGLSPKKNLRAYFEIWWQHHDETTEQITQLTAQYNEQGNTGDIDISDVINLSYQLPDVTTIGYFANAKFRLALDSFRFYDIRYADQYGVPSTPELLTKTTDRFLAIHGGYAANSQQLLSTQFGDKISLLHNTQFGGISFDKETVQRVHPNQFNWLYFYSRYDEQTANVTATIFYQQKGLTQIQETIVDLGSHQVSQGVNYITSGYRQLGLQDYATDTVTHYTVSIKIGGIGLKIVTQIYDLDYEFIDLPDTLIFDNGLGGMETINLSGNSLEKYISKGNDFLHFESRTKDNPIARNIAKKYNRKGHTVFTASTGFQTKGYLDNLRQLLLGDVFLIKNGKYFPVVIETTEFDYNSIDENLYALTIKYRFAEDDSQYNMY